MNEKLTLGQRRVRLDFNPPIEGNSVVNSEVHQMKQMYADIIDSLEAKRTTLKAVGPANEDAAAFALRTGEQFRAIAIAQTEAERACRDAVYALTF